MFSMKREEKYVSKQVKSYDYNTNTVVNFPIILVKPRKSRYG